MYGRKSFFYQVYGLSLDSQIPLPELIVAGATSTPDIRIVFSEVKPPNAGYSGVDKLVLLSKEGPRFHWRNIASYFVESGDTIHVNPAPGSSKRDYRTPLIRIVLGSILKYHNRFTLHASAVEIEGRACIFVGQKGMGKSTIAAALSARGHRLISDDVVAIDTSFASVDEIAVYSGIKQIKLTDESADAVGRKNFDVLVATQPGSKMIVSPKKPHGTDSSLLHRIYSIDDADNISLTRLSQQNALRTLLRNEYSSRILSAEPLPANQMAAALFLSKRIPVIALRRDRKLCRLSELVRTIENTTTDSVTVE